MARYVSVVAYCECVMSSTLCNSDKCNTYWVRTTHYMTHKQRSHVRWTEASSYDPHTAVNLLNCDFCALQRPHLEKTEHHHQECVWTTSQTTGVSTFAMSLMHATYTCTPSATRVRSLPLSIFQMSYTECYKITSALSIKPQLSVVPRGTAGPWRCRSWQSRACVSRVKGSKFKYGREILLCKHTQKIVLINERKRARCNLLSWSKFFLSFYWILRGIHFSNPN